MSNNLELTVFNLGKTRRDEIDTTNLLYYVWKQTIISKSVSHKNNTETKHELNNYN